MAVGHNNSVVVALSTTAPAIEERDTTVYAHPWERAVAYLELWKDVRAQLIRCDAQLRIAVPPEQAHEVGNRYRQAEQIMISLLLTVYEEETPEVRSCFKKALAQSYGALYGQLAGTLRFDG